MKNIFRIFLGLATFFILTSENGCTPPPSTQDIEQSKVEENQKRLMAETDIPILKTSLERQAIRKRLELFEDENKVSYIYLISFGKVMAFYPIKGKVTSGSKRLTTNEKVEYNYGNSYVMEGASLDGTYGSSGDYIFFWTTDGTYIQWNDCYMIADKPLKMATAPELVYNITPNK